MASSSLSQKVCVVCRRRAEGYLEHWIYVVDLKTAAGDCFTRRDPTFRIKDDFSSPCFCVLGSTLYLFQGYDYDWDADKFITHGKTVYTHPLPSSDTANLKLTRSTMSVAKPPLKDAKWFPTAVPTPDGKRILVLSTGFRSLRDDSICSFELYDPSRQTSTVIRASPLEKPTHLLLHSVKFVGPPVPCCYGPPTLHDFDLPDPIWVQECDWSRNVGRMGIPGSFILRNGWCFTGSSIHDISDDHGLLGWDFKYPPSSGGDHSSSIINDDITPLSDDDDVDASFCTLRMGHTLRPFVMLDVYKFDFVKSREQVDEVCSRVREEFERQKRVRRDEEKAPPFKRTKLLRSSSSSPIIDVHAPLPGVKIVKSIRFFDARQLEDQDDSFTTLSFFSIPTPAT